MRLGSLARKVFTLQCRGNLEEAQKGEPPRGPEVILSQVDIFYNIIQYPTSCKGLSFNSCREVFTKSSRTEGLLVLFVLVDKKERKEL